MKLTKKEIKEAEARLDFLIDTDNSTGIKYKIIDSIPKQNIDERNAVMMIMPNEDEIAINLRIKKQSLIDDPNLKKLVTYYMATFYKINADQEKDN